MIQSDTAMGKRALGLKIHQEVRTAGHVQGITNSRATSRGSEPGRGWEQHFFEMKC